MSYKYKILTGKERIVLLTVTGILLVLSALFFGTGKLIDISFPGVVKTESIWLIDSLQADKVVLFTPGGVIFVYLASICVILALSALGTAIFSTLGFLPIAIILILLVLIGGLVGAVLEVLRADDAMYAVIVLSALVLEVAGLVVLTVIVIKKMDDADRTRSLMDLLSSRRDKETRFPFDDQFLL